MKSKYYFWGMVLFAALVGILFGISTNREVPEEAKAASSPAVILQCPPADFGVDGLPKNGHPTDPDDLFTRHQQCFEEYLPLEIPVENFPHLVPTVTPKVVVVIQTKHRGNGGNNSGGGNGGGGTVQPPVKDDDKGDPDDGKACKNKNAGKDGTPDECNAGKGQEK